MYKTQVMRLGMIGRKAGMTRIFTKDGDSIPITVLEIYNNRIIQVKSIEKDFYNAIKVSYSNNTSKVNTNKPNSGNFDITGLEVNNFIKEFKLNRICIHNFSKGEFLKIDDIFKLNQLVDITGNTIGKGFSGSIKKHKFNSQNSSHGNSRSHRAPGSIGQAQDPGRVFKGKRMSGHLGNKRCTIQNLSIIRIYKKRGLIMIKGSIPGNSGSIVTIYKSIKNINKVKK